MRLFTCLLLLATSLGFSNIKTVTSFEQIEAELKNTTSKSLVLFDVDEVLISPADAVLKPIGGTFHPQSWNNVTSEQYEELLSIMLAGTDYLLIDPRAPKIIKNLQNRHIPTIGFTACRTTKFGVIPSMDNWRINQLSKLGINFSPSFPHTFFFPELVPTGTAPPLFKDGILFCGDFYIPKKSTKGKLLGVFLDRLKFRPSEVIFFDDDLKNLSAVAEELKQRNIPFRGFLFEQPPAQLNEQIAQLQFDTLLNDKTWLSDHEAQQRLISENALP